MGYWRTLVRGVGQLFITGGLVILLFVVYELWWTGFTTKRDQHQLHTTLQQQWQHGITLANPPLGSGIAILRIPRFGPKYDFVIVQGTSTADLEKGPGHYVDTAMPGQLGNFTVAGHRTTYLHPFYNINELRAGDPIVIETRTRWLTYTVENIPGTTAKYQEIVSPDDIAVSYPVPDQPDAQATPTEKVLTFTSCNPRYSAAQRIVIHALLTDSQPRSAGLPPALRDGGVVSG
ncbi:MAG TPA: class E sortase [Mycobacteriales bacterium]|nr:class E sortase [Mycobacteriales bacterium]HWA66393.1 class E sortase [Mycobacteriales bacterium]